MPYTKLLRPDRLRTVERPFGWLPCRLLQGDLLRKMGNPAKLLYLHLALAANRHGLSYWGDQRIIENLGIAPGELSQARQQLIALDLLAFNGHVYQLLSLPGGKLSEQPPQAPRRPTPSLLPASEQSPAKIPEHARLALCNILGREFLR